MQQVPQIFSPAYFACLVFISALSATFFIFSHYSRKNEEFFDCFVFKFSGYNMIAYALCFTIEAAIM